MSARKLNAPDYNSLWSDGWNHTRLYGPMARHCRRIFGLLSKDLCPKSILDVGCGEGSLLKSLMAEHKVATGTGIELSKGALLLAQNSIEGANFHVCDISESCLREKFDLVVSADVVEHIVNDEIAIQHMVNMLKPGGHLIIATLQGKMRKFEKKVGHVRNYNPGELQRKVEKAGLKVEQVITWGWPFYSPIYRNLLNLLDNKGTMGKFGFLKKTACHFLYFIFHANSAKRGDYIFVRAVNNVD